MKRGFVNGLRDSRRRVGRVVFGWWLAGAVWLGAGVGGASSVGLRAAEHQTAGYTRPLVGSALPYRVMIEEVATGGIDLPNVHSFVAGEVDGEWVLLAGRTNGLHGMTGMNAFDPAFENREVWVIDLEGRRSWRKSLDDPVASGLTRDVIDSLSGVNAQFFQDGGTLYVAGGYGYLRSRGDHVTYDALSAIDLRGLADWVKAPAGGGEAVAADHIRQVRDAFFQVTGGGMEKIGDHYQLVFGQDYEGRYRPHFNGVYTRQVRRFRIENDAAGLRVPVESRSATVPRDEFRRRDLNVLPFLERAADPAAGAPGQGVVVLSGVFTPADGAWTLPVVIGPDSAVQVGDVADPEAFRQLFQVYHCARTALFHRVTGEMHFLLFGGLTVLEFDEASGGFTQDDRVPFTNQCGLVVRDAGGGFRQHLLDATFPEIAAPGGGVLRHGTNAEFFPSRRLPLLAPRVLDLAALRGPTVIGHIFGGIVSDAGNGGNTGSSGHLFAVSLVPRSDLLPDAVAVVVVPPTPGDAGRLEWPSQPGIRYLVEESADLAAWIEASGTIVGDGSVLVWTPPDPEGEPSRRFFRVLAAAPTPGA